MPNLDCSQYSSRAAQVPAAKSIAIPNRPEPVLLNLIPLDSSPELVSKIITLGESVLDQPENVAPCIRHELSIAGRIGFMLTDPKNNSIIGITMARPTYEQGVAYVTYTFIDKDFHNLKLVGVLKSALENELVQRGYQFMTCHARCDNGYAEVISRHYKERILATAEDRDPSASPATRRFFKISLKALQ